MESNVKSCILTAHNGKGWYPSGQKRLINSLVHHGNSHDVVAVTCLPMGMGWEVIATINGAESHKKFYPQYLNNCVYTLKAAAFQYVKDLGYDTILWLDCSVWAISDIEPVFDQIASDGYYFWQSGFSVLNVTSKSCLQYFGISDRAAMIADDCSTSMFGLKLSNPNASTFLDDWLQAAKDKQFHGSRDEIPGRGMDQQKFEHRQDQAVASCLIHTMGLTMTKPGIFSQYANEKGEYPDSVCLVMRGK